MFTASSWPIMYLVIDQGNTQAKLGLFSNGELIHRCTWKESESLEEIAETLRNARPSAALIASVAGKESALNPFLEGISQVFNLSSGAELPFQMDYQTPNSLGADRKANAAAAIREFPNRNVLVVDTGTCNTYTLISFGKLIGGAISPGLVMRFEALHHFTGKLPLHIPDLEWSNVMGNSTHESILAGAQTALVLETDAMIQQYCSLFPDLVVLLTGGWNSFFEKHLKSPIFARPDFTLFGLHEILQYNLSK